MRHIAATALTLAALAATLPSAAQTARLGSLPPSAQVVTNTSALQLTQAMLDALASTNAAITAALLARTNGWAQYDALIQQTNATVRLYQSETSLRWAWLTETNLAVTTLTPYTQTNLAWETVELADAGSAWQSTNMPPTVAAGPGGFLASVAAGDAPSVFRSTDGVSWEVLESNAYLYAIAAVSNSVFTAMRYEGTNLIDHQ